MRTRCVGGPWDGRVLTTDGAHQITVPVPVNNPLPLSEQQPWDPPVIAMDHVKYQLHREHLPYSTKHVLAYVAEGTENAREAIYDMIERLWNSAE